MEKILDVDGDMIYTFAKFNKKNRRILDVESPPLVIYCSKDKNVVMELHS